MGGSDLGPLRQRSDHIHHRMPVSRVLDRLQRFHRHRLNSAARDVRSSRRPATTANAIVSLLARDEGVPPPVCFWVAGQRLYGRILSAVLCVLQPAFGASGPAFQHE